MIERILKRAAWSCCCILLAVSGSFAQVCGLTDTLLIEANQNQVFNYTMFDVFNNDLSDPAQCIDHIEIHFLHQFIERLEIHLVSPGLDTVQLIGPNTLTQGNSTVFARWNIDFVNCATTPVPDIGYEPQWDNFQANDFLPGGFYTGSYWPFQGCLEDFDSGPVNGNWQILTSNDPGSNLGGIIGFRIVLCDERGIDCCFADGGTFFNDPDTLLCVGNEYLDSLAPTPFFNFNPPDTNLYGYTYFLTESNIIQAVDSVIDLSAFPAGTYQVCGLSYLLEDVDSIPAPDGQLTYQSLRDSLLSLTPWFCGEVTEVCQNIRVDTPPPTTLLRDTICPSDTLHLVDTFFVDQGTHFINLLSVAGCDSLLQLDLVVAPSFSQTFNEVICEGDTIFSGNNAYTETGTYTNNLLTSAGCDSIVTINLTVEQPPVSMLEETICQGDTLMVGDSVLVTSGNYLIRIPQPASVCDSFVEVDLTVFDAQAVIATPDVILCNPASITLDGTASMSAGTLSFSWQDSQGNEIGTMSILPNITEGGSYTLIVSGNLNGQNCQDTSTVTTIANNTPPLLDLGEDRILNCIDSIFTLAAPPTLPAPLTYNWTSPDGNILTAPILDEVDVNRPGTYILEVTQFSNQCQARDTILITQDTISPIAAAGSDTSLTCSTLAMQLNGMASSQGTDFTYFWSSSDGHPITNPQTQSPMVVFGGSYNLLVTDTTNGCQANDQVLITYDTLAPLVNILPPALLNCSTDSLLLDASASSSGPGFLIDWTSSNGGNITSGADGLNPGVNTAGTYTLQIENQLNGCQDSTSVMVLDSSINVVANILLPDTLTCALPELRLIGENSTQGPNIIYQWQSPDGNIISATDSTNITINSVGSYQLMVLDTFTACEANATVEVVENRVFPLAEITNQPVLNCANLQDTLFARPSVDSLREYLWEGPCIVGNNDGLSVIAGCPGSYQLTVIDPETGCSRQTSVVVDGVFTQVSAAIAPPEVLTCARDTILLLGSEAGPGTVFYEWVGPDMSILGTNDSLSVTQPGSYQLVVMQPQSRCTDTTQVTVTADTSPPDLPGIPDGSINCNQPSLTLGTGLIPQANYTYQWSIASGGNFAGATDSLTVTVDAGGVYNLTVTDTLNGCSDVVVVNVLESLTPPFVDAGSDQELNCVIGEVFLNGSASTAENVITEWSGPCIETPLDQLMARATCQGVYVLSAMDTISGCSNQDTVIVMLDEVSPNAVLPPSAEISCETGTVTLDGSASTGGTFQWFFEGAPLPFVNNIIQVDTAGTYSLVIANLISSCVDSVSMEVSIDCVPTAIISPPDTLSCINEFITLDGSASLGSSNITYSWTGPAPDCFSSDTEQATVEVSCGGSYQLVVSNALLNLSDTTTISVHIDTLSPIAIAGPADTINCLSNTAFLDGSASFITPNTAIEWENTSGAVISNELTENISTGGVFFLELQDTISGCISTDVVAIQRFTNQPDINFGLSTFSCGSDTLNLEAFVNPISNNYQYQWSGTNIVGPTDNPAISVTTATTYYLEVTDTLSQCSDLDSILVMPATNCSTCIDMAMPDTLNCNQDSVLLEASFCEPCIGCSTEWSTDTGLLGLQLDSMRVFARQGGIYTLQVTDTLGIITTANVFVIADTLAPEVNLGDDHTISCFESGITIGPAQAEAGVSYAWSSLAGTPIATPTAPNIFISGSDTYILTAQFNSNGCTATDSVVVHIDTIPPMVDAGPAQAINCFSSLAQLDGSTSDSGPPFSLFWSGPAGATILNGSSVSPTVDQIGTYTLFITNTENGCQALDSVTVTDERAPVPLGVLPDDSLSCAQPIVTISVPLPDSVGYTYEWCRLDDPTDCLSNFTWSTSVPGSWSLFVQDNNTGCTASDTITIIADTEIPQFTLLPIDTLSCTQTSLALAATVTSNPADLIWQWTDVADAPLAAQNIDTASVMLPGTYYFTVEDTTNQCVQTDSITVILDENAPIALAGPDSILSCAHPSIALNGEGVTQSGQVEYEWRPLGSGNIVGSNTIPNPVIDANGTYELTVIDPVNGCQSLDTVRVNGAFIGPSADILAPQGMTISCVADTLPILIDNLQLSIGPGVAYNWGPDAPPGTIIGNNSDSSIEVFSVGTYQLILTDLGNGCSSTLSFAIDQNQELPNVNLASANPITCTELSSQLTAVLSPSLPGFSSNWSKDGVPIQAVPTPLSIIADSPGWYAFSVTNELNGCTRLDSVQVVVDSTTANINILPPPVLDCDQETGLLDASLSSSGSDFAYQWTTLGGSIDSGATGPTPVVSEGGTYILEVTKLSTGCSVMDTVVVSQSGTPIEEVILEAIDPNCIAENSGLIRVDSVIGGSVFLYALDGAPLMSQAQFAGLGVGSYTLTIENELGCSYTEIITLNEPISPLVALGPDTTIRLGDSLQLPAVIQTANLDRLVWTPSILSGTSPVVAPLNTTTYALTVFDQNGCFASDQITVRVTRDAPVYAPNIFRPDGDGINDYWTVFSRSDIKVVDRVQVFDRWGNQVFDRRDLPTNDPAAGWDGNLNGQPLNSAVFVYVIELTLPDGKVLVLEGDFTLMR